MRRTNTQMAAIDRVNHIRIKGAQRPTPPVHHYRQQFKMRRTNTRMAAIDRVNPIRIKGAQRPTPPVGKQDDHPLNIPGKPAIFYHITCDNSDYESLCVSVLHRMFDYQKTPEWSLSVFLSAFMLITGDPTSRMINAIRAWGYVIEPINFPDDRLFDDIAVDKVEILSQRQVAVFYGQLMFYPFKNLSNANHNSFMTNRTKALNSMASIGGSAVGEVILPMGLESAQRIKLAMSSCGNIKRGMVEVCLEYAVSTQAMMAQISNYVLQILDWTDMTAYSFIVAVLFKTSSPVLRHLSVAMETENILTAIIKVNESAYPQYFKIFCNPTDSYVVERSQFPLLFAVATNYLKDIYPNYLKDIYPSAWNLKGIGNLEPGIVRELSHIHAKWINISKEMVPVELLPFSDTDKEQPY